MKGRALNVVLGLTSFAVVAALLGVAVAAYDRTFVSSTDVTLHAGTVGNALQTGSDVKLHGVPVGRVSSVEPRSGGAAVTLALDPDTASTLPRDTTARLLPKTLFGERYVSLITSTGPATGLERGDIIDQDSSDEAVELDEVFDELLPLLQSIQPEKLSASLGELATTLRGRGENIGDTLVEVDQYLTKLNPQVPQITEDFDRLSRVAGIYEDAAPELLDALATFTTTSRTLVDQRSQLSDVYAQVITSADTTRGFVSNNQNTIEVLSDESRDALEAVAPYASEFPCLFAAARAYIPVMDKNLGKGTDEPGLHVQLNVVPERGKYVAGRDTVKFSSGGTPRCPYVTGQTGTTAARNASAPVPETIAPPRGDFARRTASGAGLGQANSPAENQMVAELIAPTQGIAPTDYPRWASLLLGPTLRNTKVTLQ